MQRFSGDWEKEFKPLWVLNREFNIAKEKGQNLNLNSKTVKLNLHICSFIFVAI
jgi:hypothetical protein